MRLKWIKRVVIMVMLILAAATLMLVAAGMREDVRPRDAAVVLGSKVELDGRPSVRLAARLDRGAALDASGAVRVLIVSGGLGKEGFDEGVVMRDYLVRSGVPAGAILVDSAGVDTQATAVNCARLMRQHRLQSVIAVSQYFHVPRTRLALEAHGIRDVGGAYARFFELRDLYSIARELVALPVYWVHLRRQQ